MFSLLIDTVNRLTILKHGNLIPTAHHPLLNPFMPTVPKFAVRETYVSRHNGGTSGAPHKPLRVDSALRALSHYAERRQSLGQQMLELGCENATVGKHGLIAHASIFFPCRYNTSPRGPFRGTEDLHQPLSLPRNHNLHLFYSS